MEIESRDSVNLKPAELDEIGQLLASVNLPVDHALETQVESFPLVVLATHEEELHGFMFGSLERIGGTPCILWALGAVRKGKNATTAVKGMTAELYRRAAISFPDEDVLVGTRIAHTGGYSLFASLDDVVPRPGYIATGEERAWGRRLAKRFGCDDRYDEKAFRTKKGRKAEPLFDTSAVKLGGKAATETINGADSTKGESVITFGWATAEALLDGLANPA
ncbi:MAG: hypothetical protein ACOYNI_08920 [Acidimicrobiia bacterium]